MSFLRGFHKKRKQTLVLPAPGVLLSAALADYAFYGQFPVDGKSWNRGQNAIWLKDSWWRGIETESADSLAARLQKNQIQTAYFHLRFIKSFIKKNGVLRFRGWEYSQCASIGIGDLRGLHNQCSGMENAARIVAGETEMNRFAMNRARFIGFMVQRHFCKRFHTRKPD